VTDFQPFDCSKVTGATGTSYIRFTAPAVMDIGGNTVRGVIPGYGADVTLIECGIDMRQSGNFVQGVKGYRGTNVILAAGVNRTTAILGGSSAISSDPAFIDNSGTTTNVLIEAYNGAFYIRSGVIQIGSNQLPISQNGYSIQIGANLLVPAGAVAGIGGVANGATLLNLQSDTVARSGLIATPFSAGQTADLANFYNSSAGKATSVLPLGTLIADDATKGVILKDAAATPHYWRVTVSTAGVLTTADLGTTRPTS
jgi:hypothetical protein